MKKTTNLLILAFFLSTLLTGCASYRASSLTTLPLASTPLENHTPLLVAAKKLSQQECMKYLGRDVLKEGYQPIQLTIRNQSAMPFIFSLNRLSLNTVNPLEVAQKVHTSTTGRAIGYGAAAVFVCPLFIIPAFYDSYCSHGANEKLDDDFWLKGAKDQRIEPMSHTNMLVFVEAPLNQSHFKLTLVNPELNDFKTLSISVA